MPDIYEIADEFRNRLLQRERAAAMHLIQAYAAAYARLNPQTARLLAQIEGMRAAGVDVSPTALLRLERLADLEAQVLREIARFSTEASAIITAEQGAAALHGAQDASELVKAGLELSEASASRINANFARLPTQAVEAAAGFASDGSPLAALLSERAPETVRQLREALVRGVALGQTPRKTAQEMRDAFGGDMGRALTLARTETLRAYREAARDTYIANADVLQGWVWTAALSARTCGVCIAMHGTLFPVEARLESHPNCRCAMVPLTKGRQPPPSGAEWFAEQDEAVRLEILGKSKYDAYRAGTLDLVDLVGERRDARWGRLRYERSLKDITKTVKNRGVKKIETVGATGEADAFVSHKVGGLIAADPIATRLYRRMQEAGVRVELNFHPPIDPLDFGEFDAARNVVRVFMLNTVTAQEAVSTIVHEGRHVTRRERRRKVYSFAEEVRARSLEFVYREKRRPTLAERKILRDVVRQAYPDLAQEDDKR